MKTSCTSLHKLLVAALMLLPLAGQAQEISASALEQIGALIAEKESRSPAEQKMDSQLVYLAAQAQGQPAANGVPSLQVDVQQDADDRVLVDISGTVSESLTTAITEAGGEVVNQFAPFNAIRAKVPVSILETLAARADVLSVGPAAQAITNMGSALSQADRTHKANTARGNLGVTGNGVKIGVLSDGVNSLSASKNNGNLNASATVLPGQAGSGDEGTAMMELIQDLAPGAQIIFATAFNGNASFASNIIALQAAGCSIIVDDVSYFNESPFQDQVIAQAVSTVSAAGVLYFSSAGNSGNKNDGTSGAWEGDFVSGGVVAAPVTGTGNILDFGGSTFNTVAAGGSSRRVDLFWSDPDLASANDYDLFVLDSTGASVLRSSTNLQTGTQSPYESTGTLNVGERIVIVQRAGAANRFIQLTTGRARLTISTSGVVRGHNASGAANAFCVAATDVANSPSPNVFVGGVTNPVETFSSDGPRRIFFDPAGTALTPGNFSSTGGQVLNKPDITAADGAATSVAGFTTFFGTSAAAPHAAAIAALLKSYKPSLTPAQIRTAMTSTALDIEAAGLDRDSGVGIVMAEPALISVGAPDPLVVTTSGDLNASGLVGGPFTPTTVTYTLTNTSGSPVNWTASKTQTWTTLTPTSGTLAAAANVVLTCTIDAVAAAALVAGSYADAVTITNTTSGFSRDLAVNLVVTSAALPVVLAYDNVTTFSGQVSSHGGATTTATGTTVFADDVTCVVGSAGMNVTSFQFTVSNLDVASFSARPRVRFWVADGAGGGPGTVITGFSFNPITFPANGVQIFTANIAAGQLVIPPGEKIWAGILFDGASGSTATVANLNNLGQGIFNPPAVGSSADTFWRSTSPGSNLVNNPAGSFSNFAGAPVANFGWKFQGASLATVTTATESAVTATSATLGGTVSTDGGSAVTERGIVWGLALNPTTANTKVANGSGTGAFSATVTGLPVGSTVHVRAYAINGIGTAYGSDISFTTLSNNADLSDLVLTTATLDSAFAPATLAYTSTVPNSTASLTVTPTAAQANATITVNGSPVASASPSGSISLSVGLNTITTIVTAQDTTTTKTYTVGVTRLGAPEIALFDGIAPPANERTDNTGTFGFGSVNTGSSSVAQTFTIQNLGSATANLAGIAVTQTGSTDFVLNTAGTLTSLAPGATTTFTVTFSPTSTGAKTGGIEIASNDADENPFDIALSGAGETPAEIAVEEPLGTGMTDAVSITAFGSVNVGSSSAAKTYTISNAGAATVNLTGIAVTQTGSTDFVLNTAGTLTSLAPGATTTFTVTFTPTSGGAKSGGIVIASNDADENPFDIGLSGTGVVPLPTVTAVSPTSGSTFGGTPVTITGTNFAAPATVTIGGVAATSVVVSNATTITCTTGTHAAGVVNVAVTTPSGTGTGINLFTYTNMVTNTANSGPGSLRQTVIDTLSGGTVTFDPALTSGGPVTITLTTGEIAIGKTLTIAGPGANLLTISGNNASRAFQGTLTGSTVTISGLRITACNSGAGFGGAVRSNANLVIKNCEITGNITTTGSGGGGIQVTGASGTFLNCNISDNTALNQGGGIGWQPSSSAQSFTLINCTVSGNSAIGTGGAGSGIGGGITLFASTASTSPAAVIKNCTFANNIGAGVNASALRIEAGAAGVTTTLSIFSTIFANHSPATPALATRVSGGAVSATITSLGYNLSTNGGDGFLTATGDLVNANPMLEALALNDGPTRTHKLLPGSQALGASNAALRPADTFDLDGDLDTAELLPVDQRGTAFVRVFGGAMDIGAYEVQPPPGALIFTGVPIAVSGTDYIAGGNDIPTREMNFIPTPGQSYPYIEVTGAANDIIGTFNDLPDGGVVAMNFNGVIHYFQVNYNGGVDGNDLIFTSLLNPGPANWKWTAGPDARNAVAIFGTEDVAAPTNNPGARQGAMNWRTPNGNLWMFGGYGYASALTNPPRYLNDLWEYDRVTGQWIWHSGAQVHNQPGNYTPADPALATPGARHTGTSWTDENGDLWLFGGFGLGASGTPGRLNDLWRFSMSSGEWDWMSGSNSTGAAGVYSGAPNTLTPGARQGATSWTSLNGTSLYLFGGTTDGGTTFHNDLWFFNTDSQNWVLVKGDATTNLNGTYGTQGTGAPANTPGARRDATGWVAKDGTLWLFGGRGLAATGATVGDMSDLWSFGNGNWTHISGPTTQGAAGTYTAPGSPGTPAARSAGSGWVTVDGDFWLVGGFKDSKNCYNDVWIYDIGTSTWTWQLGSSSLNVGGVYGTKDVAAPGNEPGARFTPSTWVTLNGAIWVFGGGGFDGEGNGGRLSDLWRYGIATPVGAPPEPSPEPHCHLV